ncbi:MAG: hypothetical protein RQ751_03745 [Longimicrobiales bacterium]|nr:hypothetical protein [Longimicrobiales bacterium]
MTEHLEGRPLSDRVPHPARDFARALVGAGGASVSAVLLYGSQLHRSSPGMHSAWDLLVVVERYRDYHRAMRAAGYVRRAPWLMDLLGHVLPPYVTDFQPPEAEGRVAKCLVISWDQLLRALGPHARDHFMKGRLAQHVEAVWTASDNRAERLEAALAEARLDTLRWAAPFLEAPFGPDDFTLGMLTVSFAGEIRPESRERVREVWEAQREWLRETFTGVLEAGRARGVLAGNPREGYRPVRPPGRGRRLRLRAYFLVSKLRVTARWGKHMLTFNDWLTYAQRKAERRTGLTIELTPAERRWPLLLLWPKVLRVLRHGRGAPADRETPS